jgi:hypothetical protein
MGADRLAPALFAALVLSLGVACAYPYTYAVDQRDIRETTSAYIKDLAADDGADAYALLSPTIRSRCSENSFKSELGSVSSQFAGEVPTAKLADIVIDGETATAKVVVNGVETDDPLVYHYEKQGPRWFLLPPDFTC